MKGFIKGTIFLMLVIFISKILGFIFRMYFMRGAGEEAVGYYMASYPAFIFFISLVQLGLPIAIAKLVAEHFARGEHEKIQQLMRSIFYIAFISCFIFIPTLLFVSPYIAVYLLKNEALTSLLQISVAAIPFVLFASIFKAYLQGLMKITPSAISQLLEQLIRIVMVMAVLPLYTYTSSPIALATLVMIFTVLAELSSFLFLFIAYKRNRTYKEELNENSYRYGAIFRIALPSQGSKLFGSFTWFLEPIVFLKALTSTGLTIAAATSLYGIISGVHIPLLLFPAFIPAALSIVLIPAVSEGLARGKRNSVSNRVMIALRISSLIGCIACTVFYIYGDELAKQLFHLQTDVHYMKILAPIFYFYYIQSPMHSILQSIGEAKSAMMNSVYGGVAKLFIMFVLASQPYLQEKGAIIAIGFGVVVTSFLHLITLKKQSIFHLKFSPLFIHFTLFIIASITLTNFPLPFSLYESIGVTSVIMIVLFIITKQLLISDFQKVTTILRRL